MQVVFFLCMIITWLAFLLLHPPEVCVRPDWISMLRSLANISFVNCWDFSRKAPHSTLNAEQRWFTISAFARDLRRDTKEGASYANEQLKALLLCPHKHSSSISDSTWCHALDCERFSSSGLRFCARFRSLIGRSMGELAKVRHVKSSPRLDVDMCEVSIKFT